MEETENSVKCWYKGVFRYTHPKVCDWHVRKNDPECAAAECARFARLQKQEERHANDRKTVPDESKAARSA